MRSLKFLISFFLFLSFCFLVSCGKKGPPTLKAYEKPEPPSALRAIHRESEIILLWDFPKNKEQILKGFYLMKSTGTDFERLAFLENDKRSYTDRDFKIGATYKYKIVSENLKGVMSTDSNIIEVKPQSPPAPPGKLSFKIEYNLLTLTWKDAGEDKILYNIYKSHKKGLYPLFPVNREPINETSFRDSFDIRKPVYYTVRSIRGGDIWDEGSASEELEINPSDFVPLPPEALKAVATEKKIQLIWKEAPETWVIGYRIYRERDKKEGYKLIGETQTPAFEDKEKTSIKRNYRVTALGPSKEGQPSEIRDVVFIPSR